MKKSFFVSLFVLSFWLVTSCNGQFVINRPASEPNNNPTTTTTTTTPPSKNDNTMSDNNNSFQREMLAAVNAWRQRGCKCGGKRMPATGTVSWDDKLTVAAKKHAIDIERRKVLDHTGADGSSIADRAQAAGFNWMAIAENIAFGYPDIATVVQGWIDSPGHCKNMMNGSYKEIGVAKKGTYWVMMLGTEM